MKLEDFGDPQHSSSSSLHEHAPISDLDELHDLRRQLAQLRQKLLRTEEERDEKLTILERRLARFHEDYAANSALLEADLDRTRKEREEARRDAQAARELVSDGVRTVEGCRDALKGATADRERLEEEVKRLMMVRVDSDRLKSLESENKKLKMERRRADKLEEVEAENTKLKEEWRVNMERFNLVQGENARLKNVRAENEDLRAEMDARCREIKDLKRRKDELKVERDQFKRIARGVEGMLRAQDDSQSPIEGRFGGDQRGMQTCIVVSSVCNSCELICLARATPPGACTRDLEGRTSDVTPHAVSSVLH